MKIVIDENIEYGMETFGRFGEVVKIHGRKITNSLLKDVDLLVVRSITEVNEKLLADTPVKFVGTTTIGMDHLDTEYLESKNIKYASAPGCNSFAVTEYVFTALAKIAQSNGFQLQDKSIGIIGYGNIGTKVARFAEALGMNTIINDPPLQRVNNENIFSSLEETLTADIISCHVPLNKEGIDKTIHLLDEKRISSLKPGTVLLNTCRGPVVNNTALLKRINKSNDITAVLDVWENEPKLNRELLEKVYIATAHIAGYSLEGKVNGTTMIYDELCKFLDRNPERTPELPEVKNNFITLQTGSNITSILYEITKEIYPIEKDTSSLKNLSHLSTDELSHRFDLLRKNYNLRREFNNFKIDGTYLSPSQKEQLNQMRLQVI